MSISERITGTVENWRTMWGEALKGFLITVISFGIEVFMDIMGKAMAPKLKPFIESMEKIAPLPPELKPITDEIKEPKGQAAAALAMQAGGSLMGAAIGKIIDNMLRPFLRNLSETPEFALLDIMQLLTLWLRKELSDSDLAFKLAGHGIDLNNQERLKKLAQMRLDPRTWLDAERRTYPDFTKIENDLRDQGWDTDRIDAFKLTAEARLDPITITSLWLRDKAKWEKLWKDLTDQGWTEDRIEALKERAKLIPPLADMVRFADFSAFDPDVIAKWREFYDAPGWVTDPMSLIGITNEAPRDWANKYWFSHYVQPGRYELGEMFRRSEGWKLGASPEDSEKYQRLGVNEDDLRLAYRTMAYSRFWQDRLIELSKETPTRVDVRRWYDMRTIGEEELKSIYQRQGYFGKDLENYVRWTKVYVDFPMMMTRFRNGWITEDDVKAWLRGIPIPEDRITQFIEEKTKPEKAAQVEEERKASATEIMKGVKTEYITWDEGVEMLGDLKYSKETAEFKLDVYLGVSSGSPETYSEFKRMTQRYRKAVGLSARIPPQDMVEAEKALKTAQRELHDATERGEKEPKLSPFAKAVSDAEYRYRQLLLKWQAEGK